MVGKLKGLRLAMAIFAAALFGGPALAAAPEQRSDGLTIAAWVAKTADMPAAQVAIAGPQNVYSVEPLGPPAATGEVIARVRTEAVDADWSAAHNLQSWEAHALFDCAGKRMRIVRSASYAKRNLQGEAKVDDLGGSWFAPQPAEPAAVLLAAACDRNFVWPLRAAAQPPPASPPAGALVTAKIEASEAAVAPTHADRAGAAPATGHGSAWPTHEEAARVQKASFTTSAREPPLAQAAQAGPRGRLQKLAAAPPSALAAVKRLAGAGEGFVSRRASSIRRWFAWRQPAPSDVRQAAL